MRAIQFRTTGNFPEVVPRRQFGRLAPMDVEEGRKDLPQGGGYIRYVPAALELDLSRGRVPS